MDRVRFPLLRTAGALALVASAALAFAQSASSPTGANMPSGPTSGAQQHRQPPPEALDACKALKAGQDCSFTSPRGAEQGTCFAPEGKPLACRPKHAAGGNGVSGGQQGQPPRQ